MNRQSGRKLDQEEICRGWAFLPYATHVSTIANKAPNGHSKVELALIRLIRKRVPVATRGDVRLGIGDDCAVLRPRRGEEFAVTTDLSIAGKHFWPATHPPESVGHRAIARGLSDLAAMGARPVAAFVSLALPRELAGEWMRRFYDGLLDLARARKATLAGGDLSESPIPLADIVLVGAVPSGKALLRSGARPGQALYVTGTLGGSSAGLKRLAELAESDGQIPKHRHGKSNVNAVTLHLYPQPRIAQGLWLRKRGTATAAIDLSDGISTDLMRLCEESGVAAEIDADLLPIFPGATLEQALHGGEDYELLFTAPESARLPKAIAGVPVTRVGRILRRAGKRTSITLKSARGSKALHPMGWQHFS